MMASTRDDAVAFIDGYGRAWEKWDICAFIELFTNDVFYVAHATRERVVGSTALEAYLRKEATAMGDVSVRMGTPVVEGSRVAAEFWVTGMSEGQAYTTAGCFIARLAADGRCEAFREYWFDDDGHVSAYEGWGR